MAVSALGANLQKLKDLKINDEESGNIESRVSRARAEQILEVWKRLKVKAEIQANAPEQEGLKERLLSDERSLKDQLFVETGEDIDDTFEAFKHYGLDLGITDEDRKLYANQ